MSEAFQPVGSLLSGEKGTHTALIQETKNKCGPKEGLLILTGYKGGYNEDSSL